MGIIYRVKVPNAEGDVEALAKSKGVLGDFESEGSLMSKFPV
jgi:hypothetical protein